MIDGLSQKTKSERFPPRPKQEQLGIESPYAAPRAIRIVRPGEPPFELPIYPDAEYTFGRDRSCTVVIGDETVSREHGLLSCRSDGVWVYRDRGSSNGSFLTDHFDSDAPIEDASRLAASRSYRVAAGQSVVFGNRAGRISFLATLSQTTISEAPRLSPVTVLLEKEIQRNARHRMPVFLLGATGSGKTWAARRIHELSTLAGPFVLVDCGSLPRELNSLRSELLGHVRGAYSDAREARLGKLYHADGGTLFLDEVESLSTEGQGLLLNLIDGTGDFTPLGQAANVDQKRPRFRLISASKVPLRQSGLREDLCNRLGRGGIIILPTLDERSEDIPSMVGQMIAALNVELQLEATLEPAANRLLQSAPWPGNVRELEGVVRTVVELACADALEDLGTKALFLKRNTTGQLVVDGPEPHAPQRILILADSVRRQLEQHQRALGVAPVPKVPLIHPPPAPAESNAAKRPQAYSPLEIRIALVNHGHNLTHTAAALGMATNTLKKLMKQHAIARGPG